MMTADQLSFVLSNRYDQLNSHHPESNPDVPENFITIPHHEQDFNILNHGDINTSRKHKSLSCRKPKKGIPSDPYISPFILKGRKLANQRVKQNKDNSRKPTIVTSEWTVNANAQPKLFDPTIQRQEVFKILPKNKTESSLRREQEHKKSTFTSRSISPESNHGKRDFIQENMTIRTTGREPVRKPKSRSRSRSPPQGLKRYEMGTENWDIHLLQSSQESRDFLLRPFSASVSAGDAPIVEGVSMSVSRKNEPRHTGPIERKYHSTATASSSSPPAAWKTKEPVVKYEEDFSKGDTRLTSQRSRERSRSPPVVVDPFQPPTAFKQPVIRGIVPLHTRTGTDKENQPDPSHWPVPNIVPDYRSHSRPRKHSISFHDHHRHGDHGTDSIKPIVHTFLNNTHSNLSRSKKVTTRSTSPIDPHLIASLLGTEVSPTDPHHYYTNSSNNNNNNSPQHRFESRSNQNWNRIQGRGYEATGDGGGGSSVFHDHFEASTQTAQEERKVNFSGVTGGGVIMSSSSSPHTSPRISSPRISSPRITSPRSTTTVNITPTTTNRSSSLSPRPGYPSPRSTSTTMPPMAIPSATQGESEVRVVSEVVRVLEAVGNIVRDVGRRRGPARISRQQEIRLIQQMDKHASTQGYDVNPRYGHGLGASSLPATSTNTVSSNSMTRQQSESNDIHPPPSTPFTSNTTTTTTTPNEVIIPVPDVRGEHRQAELLKPQLPSRAAIMDIIMSKLQAVERAEKEAKALLASASTTTNTEADMERSIRMKTPTHTHTQTVHHTMAKDSAAQNIPIRSHTPQTVTTRHTTSVLPQSQSQAESQSMSMSQVEGEGEVDPFQSHRSRTMATSSATSLPNAFTSNRMDRIDRDLSETWPLHVDDNIDIGHGDENMIMRAPSVLETGETAAPPLLLSLAPTRGMDGIPELGVVGMFPSRDSPDDERSEPRTTASVWSAVRDGLHVETLCAASSSSPSPSSFPLLRADYDTERSVKEYKKQLLNARRLREAPLRSRGVTLSEFVNRLSDVILEDCIEESAAEIDNIFNEFADGFVEDI